MAASDLGVLTVYMDAVTDQFHAGLQGADKAIQSFRGKLKGLNRTFTEVKNKVQVVAAAFESAFKVMNAAVVLAEGDMEKTAEIIKSLPFGIGAAMTAWEQLLKTLLGYESAMLRQEKTYKRIKTLTAEYAVAVLEQNRAVENAEARTRSMTDAIHVLMETTLHGADAGKKLGTELERAAEKADVLRKVNEQREKVTGAGATVGHSQLAVAADTKRLADAQAKLDALNDQMKVPVVGPLGMARAYQEVMLLKAEKEVEILTGRLQAQKQSLFNDQRAEVFAKETLANLEDEVELTRSLHEWEVKAADALDDAAQKELIRLAAIEKQNELMKLQAELQEAQSKRDAVLGRGLQGAANTFRSPMGTISLPALNTTAELARLQLTELQAIEQTIRDLETSIKDLSKP